MRSRLFFAASQRRPRYGRFAETRSRAGRRKRRRLEGLGSRQPRRSPKSPPGSRFRSQFPPRLTLLSSRRFFDKSHSLSFPRGFCAKSVARSFFCGVHVPASPRSEPSRRSNLPPLPFLVHILLERHRIVVFLVVCAVNERHIALPRRLQNFVHRFRIPIQLLPVPPLELLPF